MVLALRLCAAACLWRTANTESPGFLFISAPRESKVSWVKLPEDASYEGMSLHTLLDSKSGLKAPQGLAVDQKRKRLYVADPDAQKIYSYQLYLSKDQVDLDGTHTVVVEQVESRWLALDGVGNLFFSDESRNLILKLSPGRRAVRGGHSAETVYNGNAIPQVNQPGGVAVDNFHVFWTNKHFGGQVGTVVRASETPAAPSSPDTVGVLAQNLQKAYGICLSVSNIFYTSPERSLYGIKKAGGPIKEVNADFKNPRGCVWDGDGTVYVADRGANAVYAFAGNMQTIGKAEITKAFNAEDAFGLAVAVHSGALATTASCMRAFLLACLMTYLTGIF